MGLEQVCRKKDKRLLVLLALGILILFSDIEFPEDYESVVHEHFWVEMPGRANGLYRSNLNVFLTTGNEKVPVAVNETMIDGLKRSRTIGLLEKQGHNAVRVPVSSRLAFILGQPFSINTAGFDNLTLISGIGPALAANIIAYREMHGPITAPHQLEGISGIGPRMRSKLQSYFTYSVESE